MSGYVLFQSTQAAARAEALLIRAGMPVRLVPTPRHLSSECGTALSFDPAQAPPATVAAQLHSGDVPFTAIRILEPDSIAGSGERGYGADRR